MSRDGFLFFVLCLFMSCLFVRVASPIQRFIYQNIYRVNSLFFCLDLCLEFNGLFVIHF